MAQTVGGGQSCHLTVVSFPCSRSDCSALDRVRVSRDEAAGTRSSSVPPVEQSLGTSPSGHFRDSVERGTRMKKAAGGNSDGKATEAWALHTGRGSSMSSHFRRRFNHPIPTFHSTNTVHVTVEINNVQGAVTVRNAS